MITKRTGIVLLALLLLSVIVFLIWINYPRKVHEESDQRFDGDRAYQDVLKQLEFGARIPGSIAHTKTIEFIQEELSIAGWSGQILEQRINGHIAKNILAMRTGSEPAIILGAHYDSRIYADNDPSPANHNEPVPGANDGASGVAVLLELARSLPRENTPVALLFIDLEDNGNIQGWDWIQGSRAFASNLTFTPKAVVIVDMIGDKDLNIFKEQSSDVELTNQIWDIAKTLGYQSSFNSDYKYRVIDDHTPFLEKGIPAVDIIDLDYPYWHTLQDLPDKVSASSLQKVGDTLQNWIKIFGSCLQNGNCNEK